MDKNLKILVVDDDEAIRLLLVELFSSRGYHVEHASDGKKGFEKGVTEEFDLITMDIRMPHWDGVETVLGLNLVNRKSKFLIISGYINDENLQKLNECHHVIDIIHKPFDNNHVLRVVENNFK